MAVKAVLSCHKIRFSFQKRLLVIADYIEEGTFESTCLRGQLTISEQRAWVLSELQRGSLLSLLITMFKGTGATEENPRLWSPTGACNSCLSEHSYSQDLACIRITGSHHKSHRLFLVQWVGSENVYSPFAEKHRARLSTQTWPSPPGRLLMLRPAQSWRIWTGFLRDYQGSAWTCKVGGGESEVESVCGIGSDNQYFKLHRRSNSIITAKFWYGGATGPESRCGLAQIKLYLLRQGHALELATVTKSTSAHRMCWPSA